MKKILFIILFTNYTFAQTKIVDTIKVKQDFEKLINNLETNYVYYNSKDVDLNCIKKYYSQKISTLKNETEILLFFEYILNEFYDNHLHLNTNSKSSYRLYSPLFAESIANKIIISSTWKDQIQTGLNVNVTNSELLTFNGININEVIENFPTHCQNKKNSEIRNWILNKILAGKYNESRIITIKTTTGKTETIDIDKIKIRNDTSLVSYKIIDNIGIIRLNNSLGDRRTKAEFKNTLIKLKDTDGIILDLRNTISGGNTNIGNAIAGHFTNKKVIFQKYKNTKQEFVDYIKPNKPQYNKPLVVLVGRFTASMGEGLASGLNGIGIVIGTEMQKLAGATKSYNFSNFDYGYQASYIDVLNILNIPREKFVPKIKIICDDKIEDEFVKEGIRIIKEKK